jgi:type 1 glutamine amidotransferase
MVAQPNKILTLSCCILAVAITGFTWQNSVRATETGGAKILIVVGPSSHPPGTHEVAAGARLMKYCLENLENMRPVKTQLCYEWPKNAELVGVSGIVFIGDLFPPERLENPDEIKAQLTRLMSGGCGMVCVHYATGLRKQHVAEDGAHPLLGWLGGYFASGCPHHQSVARIVTATIEPETCSHPVLRGWKEFTFDDEPYWNNYFGKDGPAKNVTSLAFAMLPPDAPRKETVAWAIERADGGRGVGIVMPHYFRNWRLDDLRTMVLNSICWSAKLDIPADGVKTTLPDLATFQPAAVNR